MVDKRFGRVADSSGGLGRVAWKERRRRVEKVRWGAGERGGSEGSLWRGEAGSSLRPEEGGAEAGERLGWGRENMERQAD